MTHPYEHQEEDHQVVRVHVVNSHEMRAPAPEVIRRIPVMSSQTWTDVLTVIELLQLDPYREKAEVFLSGTGNAYICHSLGDADAVVAGGVSGAQIALPAGAGAIHFTLFSQDKAWAVLTGASPVISVVISRCA